MIEYSLRTTISRLITSKREGDCWDFKSEHYENKADLLHDILCMANSQHDKDCYIIIGVADKSGEIVGVEGNSSRWNQQQLIDFLRSKKFAGDYRPVVELHTIPIAKHEVDVIVIFNTANTPIYLREKYADTTNGKIRTVQANAIYSRVGDTNTPIDSSADYDKVEYLWEKRFGLHLSPFERMCRLVSDKIQWEKSEENHYNKLHPEFTLSFEDSERGCNEFYSYAMSNPSTSYGLISLNYYGTTLYSRQMVWLDSGRYSTVIPEWGFIPLDRYHHETLSYKYYLKDSIPYLLHCYLWDEDSHEACYARDRFLEVVLVFTSEAEMKEFHYYVMSILDAVQADIKAVKASNLSRVRGEEEPAKNVLAEEIATGIVLNQKLQAFRRLCQSGEENIDG